MNRNKLNAIIRLYKHEDKGIVCLPLASNIPEPKDKYWELTTCPKCGSSCWISEIAKNLIAEGNEGLCTACAIRSNFE